MVITSYPRTWLTRQSLLSLGAVHPVPAGQSLLSLLSRVSLQARVSPLPCRPHVSLGTHEVCTIRHGVEPARLSLLPRAALVSLGSVVRETHLALLALVPVRPRPPGDALQARPPLPARGPVHPWGPRVSRHSGVAGVSLLTSGSGLGVGWFAPLTLLALQSWVSSGTRRSCQSSLAGQTLNNSYYETSDENIIIPKSNVLLIQCMYTLL